MTARVPDDQSYNCPLPIAVPGVTTVDCRYPLIFTWETVSGPGPLTLPSQPMSVWLQSLQSKDILKIIFLLSRCKASLLVVGRCVSVLITTLFNLANVDLSIDHMQISIQKTCRYLILVLMIPNSTSAS